MLVFTCIMYNACFQLTHFKLKMLPECSILFYISSGTLEYQLNTRHTTEKTKPTFNIKLVFHCLNNFYKLNNHAKCEEKITHREKFYIVQDFPNSDVYKELPRREKFLLVTFSLEKNLGGF